MKKFTLRRVWMPFLVASTLLTMSTHTIAAPNWNTAKSEDITLFYPGQASWEWLLTDHSAAKSVRKGTQCLECHDGEEKDMGNLLVSGKKLEPNPISGKPGYIKANIKFAHDADRLYVRLEWAESGFHAPKKMDPDHAVKVAVMFADDQIKEANIAGCWAGCHDDATNMASAATGSERMLYLPASRVKLTRQGGGDALKSQAELDALLNQGIFMEYWQARLNKGQPAKGVDGYILEKRHKQDKALEASSEFRDGKWTVIMSRELKATGEGQKSFIPGNTYTVGFAIHDDHTQGRFHYLSFGRRLAIDTGKADFVATKP